MDKTRRERLIRYTPFVLWTGVVLGFSTSGASMSRTSLIIRPILELLFPGSPESTLVFYHGLIRKSAHFFEYAVLTILAARAFTGSSIGWLDNHPFLAAVAVALIIAGLDELNQSFDPARTGTFRDVILDVSAAVTAALAFAAYRHFRKN